MLDPIEPATPHQESFKTRVHMAIDAMFQDISFAESKLERNLQPGNITVSKFRMEGREVVQARTTVRINISGNV